MSYFNEAFQVILKNEGGYNNHPEDKGGETYRGIARVYFPNWPGWAIIDKVKADRAKKGDRIKSEEIINNDELNFLVRDFYQKNKWANKGLDQIKNAGVATLLFDMSTQHGNWARVVNLSLLGKPIKNWFDNSVPNTLTKQTVDNVNNAPESSYYTIANARKQYVQYLLDTGRLSRTFENGIMSRVNKFITNAWNFVLTPAGTATSLFVIAGFFF